MEDKPAVETKDVEQATTERKWQVTVTSEKQPKYARRYAVSFMSNISVALVAEEIAGMAEHEIVAYAVRKATMVNQPSILRLWVDPETGKF